MQAEVARRVTPSRSENTMPQMTKREVAARAALSVALSAFAFLLAADDFRQLVGPAVFLVVGTINAACLGYRLFLDKTVSQGEAPEPVQVVNAPGDTLEVKEGEAP